MQHRPGAEPVQAWATGRLLSTAARLAEHAWDEALAEHGFTHSRLVIAHLLSAGPATQRDLARRSGMQEQTMSRILRGMEEQGLLTRSRDDVDRRRSVVILTPTGSAALASITGSGAADRLLADALAGADVEQFRAALVALVEGLGARRWPDGGFSDGGPRAAGFSAGRAATPDEG